MCYFMFWEEWEDIYLNLADVVGIVPKTEVKLIIAWSFSVAVMYVEVWIDGGGSFNPQLSKPLGLVVS